MSSSPTSKAIWAASTRPSSAPGTPTGQLPSPGERKRPTPLVLEDVGDEGGLWSPQGSSVSSSAGSPSARGAAGRSPPLRRAQSVGMGIARVRASTMTSPLAGPAGSSLRSRAISSGVVGSPEARTDAADSRPGSASSEAGSEAAGRMKAMRGRTQSVSVLDSAIAAFKRGRRSTAGSPHSPSAASALADSRPTTPTAAASTFYRLDGLLLGRRDDVSEPVPPTIIPDKFHVVDGDETIFPSKSPGDREQVMHLKRAHKAMIADASERLMDEEEVRRPISTAGAKPADHVLFDRFLAGLRTTSKHSVEHGRPVRNTLLAILHELGRQAADVVNERGMFQLQIVDELRKHLEAEDELVAARMTRLHECVAELADAPNEVRRDMAAQVDEALRRAEQAERESERNLVHIEALREDVRAWEERQREFETQTAGSYDKILEFRREAESWRTLRQELDSKIVAQGKQLDKARKDLYESRDMTERFRRTLAVYKRRVRELRKTTLGDSEKEDDTMPDGQDVDGVLRRMAENMAADILRERDEQQRLLDLQSPAVRRKGRAGSVALPQTSSRRGSIAGSAPGTARLQATPSPVAARSPNVMRSSIASPLSSARGAAPAASQLARRRLGEPLTPSRLIQLSVPGSDGGSPMSARSQASTRALGIDDLGDADTLYDGDEPDLATLAAEEPLTLERIDAMLRQEFADGDDAVPPHGSVDEVVSVSEAGDDVDVEKAVSETATFARLVGFKSRAGKTKAKASVDGEEGGADEGDEAGKAGAKGKGKGKGKGKSRKASAPRLDPRRAEVLFTFIQTTLAERARYEQLRDEDLQPVQPFPLFVYGYLLSQHRTPKAATEVGRRMLGLIEMWRAQDLLVDLYAMFLQEELDMETLAFTLYTRAFLTQVPFGLDFPTPRVVDASSQVICAMRAELVARSVFRPFGPDHVVDVVRKLQNAAVPLSKNDRARLQAQRVAGDDAGPDIAGEPDGSGDEESDESLATRDARQAAAAQAAASSLSLAQAEEDGRALTKVFLSKALFVMARKFQAMQKGQRLRLRDMFESMEEKVSKGGGERKPGRLLHHGLFHKFMRQALPRLTAAQVDKVYSDAVVHSRAVDKDGVSFTAFWAAARMARLFSPTFERPIVHYMESFLDDDEQHVHFLLLERHFRRLEELLRPRLARLAASKFEYDRVALVRIQQLREQLLGELQVRRGHRQAGRTFRKLLLEAYRFLVVHRPASDETVLVPGSFQRQQVLAQQRRAAASASGLDVAELPRLGGEAGGVLADADLAGIELGHVVDALVAAVDGRRSADEDVVSREARHKRCPSA